MTKVLLVGGKQAGSALLSGFRVDYMNTPEAKLVAANCGVCWKGLKDSLSVERGIGPDCWMHYYKEPNALTEANRAEANAILKYIAVKGKTDEALIACKKLEELGFTMLAGRIAARLASIRIDKHVTDPAKPYTCDKFGFDHYHVFTPNSYAFNSTLKSNVNAAAFAVQQHYPYKDYSKVTSPGRFFSVLPGNRKGWIVPTANKPALWNALQKGFEGFVGVNPEGKLFVIGGVEAAKPVSEVVPGMSGYVPPTESEKIAAVVEALT
jgi:hypothetical protein